MKKFIVPILLAVVAVTAGCKKHNNASGTMQAVVSGDSIVTTNVSAELQKGGTLYITANKAATSETISLILMDYQGLGNYNIYFVPVTDSNGVVVDSNVDGNEAIYQKGILVQSSISGAINVTSAGVKGSQIVGNFNFDTQGGQIVIGTFSVTAP